MNAGKFILAILMIIVGSILSYNAVKKQNYSFLIFGIILIIIGSSINLA